MTDAQWVTIKDAAEEFKVSTKTIRRWIADGQERASGREAAMTDANRARLLEFLDDFAFEPVNEGSSYYHPLVGVVWVNEHPTSKNVRFEIRRCLRRFKDDEITDAVLRSKSERTREIFRAILEEDAELLDALGGLPPNGDVAASNS